MENGILIARRYMYAAVPPALRLTAASFGAGLISTNSGFPGAPSSRILFISLQQLFCRSEHFATLRLEDSFVSHDTSCVNECHQLVSSLPIGTVTGYPLY